MRRQGSFLAAAVAAAVLPVLAQEPATKSPAVGPEKRTEAPKGDRWSRALKDRAKRGTLHDASQTVRGDTGKWNDDAILRHAPPIGRKPPKLTLDDWADQLKERKFQVAETDDNWLLLRTRQLDDNDRVWVDRVERRGNQLTVVVNEAIWQGRYSKTFTYYGVFGVNLGRLPAGTYEARCVIQPLEFTQFEGDGRPMDNWPKDERAAEKKKTVELRTTFEVEN